MRPGGWLESSIRHLVTEAGSGRPGCAVLLSKMAEALFIETLRRYMEQLPPEHTGWLAGARDPIVGGVLVLLHRKPHHPWTLDEIAHEVGGSRSVVAERFTRILGEPPLSYLARWRMQLAARLLETTHKPVLQVASDVGYEFGGRLQSRLQARVRPAAGAVSQKGREQRRERELAVNRRTRHSAAMAANAFVYCGRAKT